MSGGENFHKSKESHTSFIFYSSCSKTPIIWKWEMVSCSYIVSMIVNLFICPFAFYIQYKLFKKQSQLQKQRADGIMVVTYNQDNVTIQRRFPDEKTGRKLSNFYRTAVTPKASFLSYLLLILFHFLNCYFLFSMGTSGPLVWEQLTINLTLFVHFFLQTLTETIFSPTVQRTLINVVPCHPKRVYHVVNA